MSEPRELGSPQSDVTHTDTPDLSVLAQVQLVQFKLSLPGKNIGGDWLCQNTGGALAYQSYCLPYGSVRRFKWYPYTDGKTYLVDQDGHWLSYESIWQMLYMSDWNYAVAWQMEGNRLVRVNDGAVLTCNPPEKWPFSRSDYYLSADPPSEYTLNVEEVAVGA
jgi:hypothetical protein